MKKLMRKRICIFSYMLCFFIWAPAHAQERVEFYNSIRSLGMGGASIAVVNDETALLDNPAALGKLRDMYGTVIDPDISMGINVNQIYQANPISDFVSISDVADSLNTSRNIRYHWRQQVFPSIVLKNFGVGIFAKYSLDAQMNADGTAMTTEYYNDLALVFGYNFRLWDGRIKLGFNVKAINRIEVVGDLDPTGSLDPGTIGSEGMALGTDVGLIITAPWAYLPTLSLVGRNIGNTQFINPGMLLNTSSRPRDLEYDVDAAIAFFPIHASNRRSSFTYQYNGLFSRPNETDGRKRHHLGYEYNIHDLFFLRLGYNQRYLTYGLEIASERTQLQLAYYSEEVGTAEQPEGDTRLVLKYSYRF